MSYCRMNGKDSDVYVVGTVDRIECIGCKLHSGQWHRTKKRSEMVRHLLDHRKAGDKVPRYAIDRLNGEIVAHGDHYIPHHFQVLSDMVEELDANKS